MCPYCGSENLTNHDENTWYCEDCEQFFDNWCLEGKDEKEENY